MASALPEGEVEGRGVMPAWGVTRVEWDKAWWEVYRAEMRKRNVPARAFEIAHRRTRKAFGPRPSGLRTRPPLWMLLGGEDMKRLWDWLNGKKTIIAAVLIAIPTALELIGSTLEAGGLDIVRWDQIAGIVLLFVGLMHKMMKLMGLADGPAPKGTLKR